MIIELIDIGMIYSRCIQRGKDFDVTFDYLGQGIRMYSIVCDTEDIYGLGRSKDVD